MSVQDIKKHLDTIMDVSENNVPEGDFLTITSSLKDIYDTVSSIVKKKDSNEHQTVHNSHFCPQHFMTVRDQRINSVSFRLSVDEQRMVLVPRLESFYNDLFRPIEEEITIWNSRLKDILIEKKLAFERFKSAKCTFDSGLKYETKLEWKKHLDEEKAIKNMLYDLKYEFNDLKLTFELRKEAMEIINGLDSE